jgi:hypothetical protein
VAALSGPAFSQAGANLREQPRIDAVTAAEPQLPHPATGCLQLLGDRLAGREGHHRVLLAMGEQDFSLRPARLPARMGVATAAHQSGQRQLLLAGDIAAAHIERHRPTLGESQQGRGLQRHRGSQRQQSCPQPSPRLRQIRPSRVLQVVPLPAKSGRMGPGGAQGHHAHVWIHQFQAKLQQVIGIGSPAVQQHQPA